MKQITEEQITEAAIAMYGNYPNTFGGQRDGFMDGAKWMQSQQPEWVSVEDRLPESGDTVLIWQENLSDKECSRLQKAVYFTGYFKVYPHVRDSVYKLQNNFQGYDLEGDTCQITHWIQSPDRPNS